MSVSERNHRIVVAGAGYAGLHVAMRLATKLRDNPGVQLTLVDWHDFHQVMTECHGLAAPGLRTPSAIPLDDVVAQELRFVETQITGFDLAGQQLKTQAGPIGYTGLVLALGSQPNDFAISGPAERAISLYSVPAPSGCGRRSTKLSPRPRPPQIPTSSGAWRPRSSVGAAPPGGSVPGEWLGS